MKKNRVYKTCISLYNKAKKKKPNKPERDYLKFVLLTKPPYDYQSDKVIDSILGECADDINKLAEFISEMQIKDIETDSVWEARNRNLKLDKQKYKERNEVFFEEFWK